MERWEIKDLHWFTEVLLESFDLTQRSSAIENLKWTNSTNLVLAYIEGHIRCRVKIISIYRLQDYKVYLLFDKCSMFSHLHSDSLIKKKYENSRQSNSGR